VRAAGHEVVARNRAGGGGEDPVLSHVDKLGYDQLWLMAVDIGDGLTKADAARPGAPVRTQLGAKRHLQHF
jgi:hypothetical protein